VKEAGAEGVVPKTAALEAENADLRARLSEAEDTLRALREGQVDAIVIGGDVYTLEGANAASNRLRGDALAQMQDGVVAVDLEGRVTYLNAAAEQLYGQAASDVLGKQVPALFTRRWLSADDEAEAARAIGAARFWRGQSVHVTSAGAEIRVESALSPLRDRADDVIGMLEVIRDVGERERAQEALRDADRRKDEFLATLAHELRNPLAPIMNALAIMRSAKEPHVHDRFLQMIERQATQLVHLVEDLLDVGRISQGKLQLRRETLEIAAVVRNAGETCRPLIERQGHALAYRVPTEPVLVDGDLTRLTQVFANILDNAAKYTPPGGRIDVLVTTDGGDVVVSVADTGIGVAPAKLASVFEMFTQIEASSTKAQGGLGIGLALVRRLVGLHGGSVTAHSDGIGSGLTVVVRLPKLAATTSRSEQLVGADLPPTRPAGSLRVLVADDNADSRESIAAMLELMSCEAVTASNGAEAVALARSLRPEIAILDIGMPDLDGNESARRIRADGGADMMLIALTGWGQDEDRRKTAAAGFDHHLIKPLDVVALERLIETRRQAPPTAQRAPDNPRTAP